MVLLGRERAMREDSLQERMSSEVPSWCGGGKLYDPQPKMGCASSIELKVVDSLSIAVKRKNIALT